VTRNLLAIGVGAVLATACSSSGPQDARRGATGSTVDPGASPGPATGSFSAELLLPSGSSIATIGYTLSNTTQVYSGIAHVESSAVASLVVANVASGSGYELRLSATTTDGAVGCAGKVSGITVAASLSTLVDVNLMCTTICGGRQVAVPDSATGACTGVDAAGRPVVNPGAPDAAGHYCCVSPLAPCTVPGQTRCVTCAGSAGGLCSPTEAAFVQRDIDRLAATAAGPDPGGSCYACLFAARCLDDTLYTDTGHECGDLPAGTLFGGDGGGAGQDDQALCLSTLRCVLGSSCAAPGAGGIVSCYCGSAGGPRAACATTTGGQNGACFVDESNGLPYAPTDAFDILNGYFDTAQPSGVANQLASCAAAAGCAQCLQ
jgi:hypothetical protein